jgi:hypothetical protein
MRIRIQLPLRIRIQFRIQGFDDQKLVKIYSWEFLYIFLSKIAIYLSRGLPKAGESFNPQKRTSSTSKHENSLLSSIFVGHFCPPGSGSGSATQINADPDPQPCFKVILNFKLFMEQKGATL